MPPSGSDGDDGAAGAAADSDGGDANDDGTAPEVVDLEHYHFRTPKHLGYSPGHLSCSVDDCCSTLKHCCWGLLG